MYDKIARAFLASVLLGIAGPLQASFHLWQITEVYSNADGTVQFIELSTAFGLEQFVGGHAITATQGASTHTFTLPTDLPSDSTNKKFLIATQGFAALNLVTPDYVVPNNFLFIPNGTVNWAGVDSVTYGALPNDGVHSIDRNAVPGINSPTNFAGASGSIAPPATAPGAPIIGAAVAGSGQASISFAPPASDGGSPIISYTVTCSPGAVAATGSTSPITVLGLTNGTPYTCSVLATNAVGPGPASGTIGVTPAAAVITSVNGASATGTGTISASVSGGGPGCGFTTAQFIALANNPSSPPAGSAPQGILFPHGLFAFTLGGCTAGATATLVVTYPSPLSPDALYWKYGPTPSQTAPHWYVLPAIIAGSTATIAIVDGGLGDDDLAANGTVVDQGGPGVGAPTPIPTLSDWMLVVLALAMLALAARRRIATG